MKRLSAAVHTASRIGLVAGTVFGVSACSLSDLVNTDGEPGRIDPDGMKTEEAALLLFNGAVHPFRLVFGGQYTTDGGIVRMTAIFTDEMMTGAYVGAPTLPTVNVNNSVYELDSRSVPQDQSLRRQMVEPIYRNLHLARNQAADAIHALTNYAPNQPKDLTGHMYSIRGWTLTWLAEIFCSGIPLTEYLGGGGYVYKPGVSSDSVYKVALAQFDSAIVLFRDSVNYKYFAQVGKARVLLNLGRFADAAAAVDGVPTNFEYRALYSTSGVGPSVVATVWGSNTSNPESTIGTVGEREGGNGLPFVSARDPRVRLTNAPTQNTAYPLTIYKIPAWLVPTGTPWFGTSTAPHKAQSMVISNGIAARLIEAEAAINAGSPSFLTILNTLRTNGTYSLIDTIDRIDTTMGVIDTTEVIDTAWAAGTGGVAKLGPLTDPGNKNARIKLLYDERAFWLYFTGNRQGDLRRLVRLYGMPHQTVYPSGNAPFEPFRSFGSDVNIPVPYSENALNPHYTGCINRDA
jgi:hypothetical protein